MFGAGGGQINLSGRPPIWSTYFEHFRSHPWFGLGLGSAQPGVLHSMLPHDEFLRLLVEGGMTGAVLYLGAILLWTRHVWTQLHEQDRPWLIAFMLA